MREAAATDDAPDYELLIDTTHSLELRRALENGVPYLSTREAAEWSLRALEKLSTSELRVSALQDSVRLRVQAP